MTCLPTCFTAPLSGPATNREPSSAVLEATMQPAAPLPPPAGSPRGSRCLRSAAGKVARTQTHKLQLGTWLQEPLSCRRKCCPLASIICPAVPSYWPLPATQPAWHPPVTVRGSSSLASAPCSDSPSTYGPLLPSAAGGADHARAAPLALPPALLLPLLGLPRLAGRPSGPYRTQELSRASSTSARGRVRAAKMITPSY